jgi:hypothetical protein
MDRALAVAVFAVAAAGMTLTASGVVVAPHQDPPGTPRFHQHVLAAYRYPLFVIRFLEGSADENQPRFSASAPLVDLAAVVAFALLAWRVPRLPRPARRPLARVEVPQLRATLWRSAPAHAPPRAVLLAG